MAQHSTDNFVRPYVDGKYLHKGPTDIGKTAIPKKDRCEGFDELWMRVYADVLQYWERVPVTDIHEFDQYQKIEE